MNEEDDIIVDQIIATLRVYASFMEMAGASKKDVSAKDIARQAYEVMESAEIKDPRRRVRIMLAVADRL